MLTYAQFDSLSKSDRLKFFEETPNAEIKATFESFTKKERRTAFFKYFKRNILPALLFGGIGAILISEDKKVKKLGIANVLIGVSGGLSGIDPTQAGTIQKIIKPNNLTKVNDLSSNEDAFLSWKLLSDPTNGISNVSVQDGIVTVTKNGLTHYLEYDPTKPQELLGTVLSLKDATDSETLQVAGKGLALIGNDKTKFSAFISKIWNFSKTNKETIIGGLSSLGLIKNQQFLDFVRGNQYDTPIFIEPIQTGFDLQSFFTENWWKLGLAVGGLWYLSKKD
jgi:hypothetical protein